MSLRPRYSLLTLLVLTALVAGGVKLWYGPHRVVEEGAPGWQLEYTYTRNWRGEKLVDGPSVIRIRHPNSKGLSITVGYFSKNQQLPWEYVLFNCRKNSPRPGIFADNLELLQRMPLAAPEHVAFRQAVETEHLNKVPDAEGEWVWYERLYERVAEPEVIMDNTFRAWETRYHYLLSQRKE